MYHSYERVYVMTFLPTGKKYVGKTTMPLANRLSSHLWRLKHGNHPSKELQADFNAYNGKKDDFTIEFVAWQVLQRGQHMDKERQLMVDLKTYDVRYGYNSQDSSMQRLRKLGYIS